MLGHQPCQKIYAYHSSNVFFSCIVGSHICILKDVEQQLHLPVQYSTVQSVEVLLSGYFSSSDYYSLALSKLATISSSGGI